MHKSSVECNKVVSDIFGKFEFLMKYQNIGLYAYFAPFLKVLFLFFSEILRKNGVKRYLPRSCIKRKTRFALTTLKLIDY